DPLQLDVLTVVGTVGALERSSGLRASQAQVAFALADSTDDEAVADALLVLQGRRLIAYRQHRDSYIIWEGSDLDLDALAQEARRSLLDERAELEHDRPARSEVAGRLIEAQQALTYVIAETYGGERSRWFYRQEWQPVASARQIDELLSKAADATYPQTPRVW